MAPLFDVGADGTLLPDDDAVAGLHESKSGVEADGAGADDGYSVSGHRPFVPTAALLLLNVVTRHAAIEPDALHLIPLA